MPQFLADQLTLFKPGGGIVPNTILLPSLRIFRPAAGPELCGGQVQCPV